MIIKEITLKNFQCYFGNHSDNKIVFSRGVNLIIGNNGGGKSKLFDAFYWIIYNQVFQSDTRTFIPTVQYRENLISDKAKSLCKEGEQASTEITLHVTDSQDQYYRITRIYKATKISDREWRGNQDSTLLIEIIKNDKPQVVTSDKYEDILNRVIPGHLKPYMWFQGEQVDSLMDFKNKSSLMKTINLLSDVGDYDNLIELSKSASDKANSSLSKARKDKSKDQAESERLNRAEQTHRSEIIRLKKDIIEYQSQIENAKESIEELIGQLSDAKQKIEYKKERAIAESERKRAEDNLEKRVKALNGRLFSDFWLLKNVQGYSDKFSEKYKVYYKRHQDIQAAHEPQSHKLPIDMPQPIHVQEMLDAHECFVCGRPVAEGSPEYHQIQSLLDRKKPISKEIFPNDCEKLFEDLYGNTLGLSHIVKNLSIKIPEEFKEIQDLRAQVNSSVETLKTIDQKFADFLEDDQSENIVKAFKQHENNRERYSNLKSSSEYDLKQEEAGLEHVQKKQDQLSKGMVDSSIELSAEIWDSLHKISVSTRRAVFKDLVNELETTANKIFSEMTARNHAITGKLRLNIVSDEKISAEIVDTEGFTLTGSNDSNIILVKLSLMMAILQARELWSKNYCMVTDAPTSKMATEYSQGFYEALSENFVQSIVMTYDFLDPESLKNIEGVNIGKVYRLSPQYPNGNKEDRNDLSICIDEVTI